MSIVTPNMGLTRWDSIADFFSHAQLSANFADIDSHNHTAGKGVQIPTGGVADSAITSNKIAVAAITSGKLADSSVTVAKINSKLTSTYRPIHRTQGYIGSVGALAAGTYVLGFNPAVLSGQESNFPPPTLPFVATDHAVNGLVTKMRLRGSLVVGGVGPGTSLTFGLHPITMSGSFAITLGAAVTGSTVLLGAPSALATQTFATSDFSVPGNGVYAIGTQLAGLSTAGSGFGATVDVQVRNV